MMLSVGSLVRAKAGRDKDKFFLVKDVSEGFAYICDGKRRKLTNPKKKNLIHLELTNTIAEDSMDTDRKIRKFLSEYAQKSL